MPGPDMSAAEVIEEFQRINRWDLDESSRLFVAKSKTTGLYLKRAEKWLSGQRTWMEAAKPTVSEVIEQMEFSADHFGNWWTDDLQQADIWQRYYINEYAKYFSDDIVYQKVDISAR